MPSLASSTLLIVARDPQQSAVFAERQRGLWPELNILHHVPGRTQTEVAVVVLLDEGNGIDSSLRAEVCERYPQAELIVASLTQGVDALGRAIATGARVMSDPGQASQDRVEVPPQVLEKITRLSQTPDILAAYLMHKGEVVTSRCTSSLDESAIRRALGGLAEVMREMQGQQGGEPGTEIQATVGEHRLVVDRLGPAALGFEIGVLVRQATPVCKSLRRLLRQIDRSFRRSLAQAEQTPSS